MRVMALQRKLEEVEGVDMGDVSETTVRFGCLECGVPHYVRTHRHWLPMKELTRLVDEVAAEHAGAHQQLRGHQAEIWRLTLDNAELEVQIADNDWAIEELRRAENEELRRRISTNEWRLTNVGQRRPIASHAQGVPDESAKHNRPR